MKVSIIGPGRVGSAIGLVLVAHGIVDDLLLVGRRADVAQGEADDLQHAAAFTRRTRVRSGTVADTADSDVVVISLSTAVPNAVVGRGAGAAALAAVLHDLVPRIATASPNAVLLVASNPNDAVTTLVGRLSHFPPGRVLGTGTLLDTMRLRVRLSEMCGIHPNDLRVYVLGEHGDAQFVAASSASAGGGPLPTTAERLRELEAEVRRAGHAIVTSKGYTNQGVAMAAAEVVEAIATDRRAVLPLSVRVDGFAGVSDVCLSLPVVVGRGGATSVLPVQLSDAEAVAFRKSADAVRATLAPLLSVAANQRGL